MDEERNAGETAGPAETIAATGQPAGEPPATTAEPGGPAARDPGAAKADEKFSLEWSVRRKAVYHQMRGEFLEKAHRFLMLLVVVFGGAAFINVLPADTLAYVALVPVVAGLIDIIYAPSKNAMVHDVLYQQLMDLLLEVETSGASLDAKQRLKHIDSNTPNPFFSALDAVAHNHCCTHYEIDERYRLRVGWRRPLKNVFTFSSTTFKREKG